MGLSQSLIENQALKASAFTQAFTIDRTISNKIRIGLNKSGDGIKYFPNADEHQCYYSLVQNYKKENNSVIYNYFDGGVLEVKKNNGQLYYNYKRENVDDSGVFVLPYKTISMGSKYDEIAELK